MCVWFCMPLLRCERSGRCDTTPYGDSPLATSSFRVYHARRMSNAIIVADSRAVERYLGLHSPRQVGASAALHPIDERAGY